MGSEILVVKDSITSIRDVHEAFQAETKAETEALTHETEARPRRLPVDPRRDRDRGVSARG